MKEIYDQVGKLILLQEVIQGHMDNELSKEKNYDAELEVCDED
jgi:hypothetical protein